ncbi:unnamed protein product [Ectocarpus sp. 8 AP-2014]
MLRRSSAAGFEADSKTAFVWFLVFARKNGGRSCPTSLVPQMFFSLETRLKYVCFAFCSLCLANTCTRRDDVETRACFSRSGSCVGSEGGLPFVPAPAVGLISHAQQTLCTTNVMSTIIVFYILLLRCCALGRGREELIRNALHVIFRVFVHSEEKTQPAGGLLCSTTVHFFFEEVGGRRLFLIIIVRI